MNSLRDRHDVYTLLRDLGASPRLLTHLQLVGEAADLLVAALRKLELMFDASWVELGVAVHDAGKIQHPAELDAPGALHEPAGEALLLAQGVPAHIARCCVSHAQWRDDGLALEERLVALADKLWKGKREPELETLVVEAVMQRMGGHADRWPLLMALDTAFEDIAAGGPGRLARSRIR